MDATFVSSPNQRSEYVVQSPDNSPPEAGAQENIEHVSVRCGAHNQVQKMGKVADMAAQLSRKRNLEGLYKEEDKGAIYAGVEQIVDAATKLAGTSAGGSAQAFSASGVLMITDG